MPLPPPRPPSPTYPGLSSLATRSSQVRLAHSAACCHNQPLEDIAAKTAPGFSSFRKLPPEVRIRIWRLALLPRLITIIPRFDREASAYKVEVEAQPVQLLSVCQESRIEASKSHSQIKFKKGKAAATPIDWSCDTLFLDLLHDSVNVDNIMAFLGPTIQSVQVLAIRMRTHVFWGFPDFLREASNLQKLIFVDESERGSISRSVNAYIYLMDLGSLGFVKGCYIDPIKLVERPQSERFYVRQWEMPLEVISWVRNLKASGERYCLLLPVT